MFETVVDYERAMFGGPWMINDQLIGDRIGRTVRIDHTTLEGSRGNFVRICVEVDLSITSSLEVLSAKKNLAD
ncbi:hypothetical protein LINPERHAP2_LOCUS7064 [Linum perenne]